MFQSQKQKRSDQSVRCSLLVSKVQDMPTWVLLWKFSGGFSYAVAASISAFCHACSCNSTLVNWIACCSEDQTFLNLPTVTYGSFLMFWARDLWSDGVHLKAFVCCCFCLLHFSCYFFTPLSLLHFLSPCSGLFLPWILAAATSHASPLSSPDNFSYSWS